MRKKDPGSPEGVMGSGGFLGEGWSGAANSVGTRARPMCLSTIEFGAATFESLLSGFD